MTYADRIPAPRPIPGMSARFADARRCGHTPEQHRHDDGQNADTRSKDRAIRELLADLTDAGNTIDLAEATLRRAGHADPGASLAELIDRLARDLDSTQQVATFRQSVIDRHRQELGAAGEVLAVVRDAAERIERALARYDTQPSEQPASVTITLDNSQGKYTPAEPEVTWGEAQVIEGLRNGAAHPLMQKGAANLIERLIRERTAGLGSPSPRAQDGWRRCRGCHACSDDLSQDPAAVERTETP